MKNFFKNYNCVRNNRNVVSDGHEFKANMSRQYISLSLFIYLSGCKLVSQLVANLTYDFVI